MNSELLGIQFQGSGWNSGSKFLKYQAHTPGKLFGPPYKSASLTEFSHFDQYAMLPLWGAAVGRIGFYLCQHVVENMKTWLVHSLMLHKVLSKKIASLAMFDLYAMLPPAWAVLSCAKLRFIFVTTL